MLKFINTSNGEVVKVNIKDLEVNMVEVSSKFDMLPAKRAAGLVVDGADISITKDDGLPLFMIQREEGVITGILVRNEEEKKTLIEKADENEYGEEIIDLYKKEATENTIFFATDREDIAEVLSDVAWFMKIMSIKDDDCIN